MTILPKFKITPTNQEILNKLIEDGNPTSWIISAKNETQAWGKFVTQHFGALEPDRWQYMVTLHLPR